MEAATLPKKKNSISKGKLKKNIKNVICRPDQVLWPEVSDEHKTRLELILTKHKIEVPNFKKPHWNELKLIPKEKRPKPPKIKKVNGLLFGITVCSNAIQANECSAVIIESTVNPRMIVEPVIEMCTLKEIPVLCMKDLSKITLKNFGVKTSCLGIKKESLLDVYNEIKDLSKLYFVPKPNKILTTENEVSKIDIDEKPEIKSAKMEVSEFPYLYRTNKKTRVFVPNPQDVAQKPKKFIGQDFIEFSDKPEAPSKSYMKMILKRISNNPDRVKKK